MGELPRLTDPLGTPLPHKLLTQCQLLMPTPAMSSVTPLPNSQEPPKLTVLLGTPLPHKHLTQGQLLMLTPAMSSEMPPQNTHQLPRLTVPVLSQLVQCQMEAMFNFSLRMVLPFNLTHTAALLDAPNIFSQNQRKTIIQLTTLFQTLEWIRTSKPL